MRQFLERLLPAGSFSRSVTAQQRSFLKNVGFLTGGTVFAHGLMVIALPLLTRLYSPEDFAILAVFASVLGFITVISCLRYNFAIPLPQDDKDGMALLAVSLLAAILVSVLCSLPIALAPEETASWLGNPRIEPFLWLIPFSVFVASTYNALQYWASRKKRFGLISKTRVTRAVGSLGAQLGVGVFSASPMGLIVGQILYSGLGVWGLTRDLFKSDRSSYAAVSVTRVRKVLGENVEFATRSTPAALLDAGYQFLPILILATVAGEAELGALFLLMRAMSAPVSLVGASIAQVYLASASEKLRSGTLGKATRRIMTGMFCVGAPSIAFLAVMLVHFDEWVFGSSFGSAGTIAVWMAPWVILQLTCSPVSSFFIVRGWQNLWLLLQAIGFLIIVGGTILAARIAPDVAIEYFVFGNFVFYLIVSASILAATFREEGVD